MSEHPHGRVRGRERKVAGVDQSDARDSVPEDTQSTLLCLAKRTDHGPHSNEIDAHWGTKGLLESGSKLVPDFVTALVESISKSDLLIVVSWQKAYLLSRNVDREIKF